MSRKQLFYFLCEHSMFVVLFSFSPFHTFDQQSGKSYFYFNSKIIIFDIDLRRPYKNQRGWTLAACSGPKSWVLYFSRSHHLFLLFCPPKLMLPATIVSGVILHFIIMFKPYVWLPDSPQQEIHSFQQRDFIFPFQCFVWYGIILFQTMERLDWYFLKSCPLMKPTRPRGKK